MKITYFFLYGRKERLKNNPDCPKEMFYSYDYFKKNHKETEILEFIDDRKTFSGKLLRFFDRALNKFTKLPFFTYNALTTKNLKTILKTDYLIMAQDRIALSVLPILIISKFINKNKNFTFFVMGLYSNKPNIGIFYRLRNVILKILYMTVTNIIFLGEGEYKHALRNYPYLKKKSHLLPFMVDYDFWNSKNESENKNGILFVGNDANRDFEMLIDITNKFKNIDFTYVTKKYKFNKPKVENAKIIDGSWGNQLISDYELKQLYNQSKLTIIPLLNSYQPSGQSVALQSMCVGTPVLISLTDGFWDRKNFVDRDNIIFVKENDIDDWVSLIEEYYYDDIKSKAVSSSASKLIKTKYKSDFFNKKMKEIIGI